jgi:glycosyltransferase involved in cell wall biosynthesis
MRVLFATTVIAQHVDSGGDLVSLATVEALRQLGCEVTILGYLRPEVDVEADDGTVPAGRRPIETSTSHVHAGIWMARSLIFGRPYTAEKFYGGRYGRLMRQLVTERQFDVVCVDHTQMAWVLDWLPEEMPVWLLMHNAESDLYARSAGFQLSLPARFLYRRESRKLRRLEKSAAARAEKIFVLSLADRDAVRAAAPEARVTVLPVMPEPKGAPRPNAGEPHFDVALLATWSWLPNLHALRWFLEEVHPRLPRDLSIHVAGRGAERLLGGVAGITYRGFVPDVASFLSGAKVVAVPTRYGSGVETKMLTAIACGCPIVATAASTRGLGPLPASVAIADDAALFARLLVEKAEAEEVPGRIQAASSWSRDRRGAFLSAIRHALLSSEAAIVEPRRDPAPSSYRARSVST